MRLIDADALIEAHYQHCNEHHGDTDIFYGWSLELMQNAPTIDAMKIEPADVAPVRHGRWKHERLPSTSGGSYAVVRCSACEYQYPMAETRYCPNCGAIMDDGYILITGKEQI